MLGAGRRAQRSALHVWRLMLGYLDLLVRPMLRWVPLPDPEDFVRIHPHRESTVLLSPFDEAQAKVRWGAAPKGTTVTQAN